MSAHGAVKFHGKVKVAWTRVLRHAGRTAFETPFVMAEEETLTPTPMKVTPCVVMFLYAAESAGRLFATLSLEIKRPPYCAIPTLMFPYGSGPKYVL